jgi:acyl dehydratase
VHFNIGDELPELITAPLTPADFAQYAAASGDQNPLHLHAETAYAAGQPDVIAHGMLVMGMLGRVVGLFTESGALRELHTRFVAPTFPGEVLHCGGRVTALEDDWITGELWARNADGALKAAGAFVAALQRERV